MQRRMAAGSSFAETTITGTLGNWARIYIKTREAACARHGQVEKDEVHVAVALEQFNKLVERAGLGDVWPLEQTGHGLAQGAAEKWMIVGDHQPILYGISQPQWSFGSVGVTATTSKLMFLLPHLQCK